MAVVSALVTAIAALVLSLLARRVYALISNPLNKFPGPWSAKFTRQWQAKAFQSGAPEEVFEAAHRQYNAKAIRTSPTQLHITDIEAYRKIYNLSKPYLKDRHFYECFNVPHSIFTELDPEAHRIRKKLLASFFSTASVKKTEGLIYEKLGMVEAKLKAKCAGRAVNGNNVMRCFATDVISTLCFGKGLKATEMSTLSFESDYARAFDVLNSLPFKQYHSLFLDILAKNVPPGLVALVDSGIRHLLVIRSFATKCLAEHSALDKTDMPVLLFDSLHSISEEERVCDALVILGAGFDTTAYAISTGLFYILSDQSVLEKLKQAVTSLGTDRLPSLPQLDNSTYMQACVKETLRVAMPVSGQLPRVVPPSSDPLIVDGKVVPAGTVVGMSAYTMHRAKEVWGDDADQFRPERWLKPQAKQLDAYLVSFGKGTRQCLGMNLATAEIAAAYAFFLTKFDMKLESGLPRRRDLFSSAYETPGPMMRFDAR